MVNIVVRLVYSHVRALRYPLLLWIPLAFIWWKLPMETPYFDVLHRQNYTQFYQLDKFYPPEDTCYESEYEMPRYFDSNVYFSLEYHISKDIDGPYVLWIGDQLSLPLTQASFLPELEKVININAPISKDFSIPFYPLGDSIWLYQQLLPEKFAGVPIRAVLDPTNLNGDYEVRLYPLSGYFSTKCNFSKAPPPFLIIEFDDSIPHILNPVYPAITPSNLAILRAILYAYVGGLPLSTMAIGMGFGFILRALWNIFSTILTVSIWLALIAAGGFGLYGVVWWYRNGRPSLPVQETVVSIRIVVSEQVEKALSDARDKAQNVIVPARRQNDLEAQGPEKHSKEMAGSDIPVS
ncbi:hypothetical protein DL96DRAFT_1596313 [Flagelloscypha sp. PMI_526]|nr:hypothetical protein DL96DRAFT_1596313 [Flagelloscypha sp. PMI_526]